MTNYIPCTETAKLVRKALKEAFPGIKFSVRSRGSIDVSWTDGPTDKDVNNIVKRFEGATFCGMTDYKGGKVHTLNGEKVYFGADFIFTNRTLTADFVEECVSTYAAMDGQAQCDLWNKTTNCEWYKRDTQNLEHNSAEYVAIMGKVLADNTGTIRLPSKLANSVKVVSTF